MDVSLCVLVVLAMVFSGARANFDCSRDINQCMASSTCDRTTGMCTCADPGLNEGYDCSVVIADKAHADCTASTCKNGGTCHKSGSAAAISCLCTAKWKGATCEENRYEVECDPIADKMSFRIQPQVPTFSGKMYYFGTPTCNLIDNGGTYERLNIEFDGDATCGTADTSGSQRTRVVLIQYSTDSVFDRDELVTFTCDQDSTVTKTSSGTITHVDSALVAITDAKVPGAGDVTMTMNKGGTVIASGDVINIGDQIDIVFTLLNTVDYKGMLVKDCILSNKDTANSGDGDYKSGKFFEEYCEKNGLERSGFTDVSGTDIEKMFSYHASYFDGVLKTVFLTCQVTVCSKVGACVAATCTAPITGNGLGRRKRAAGEKEQTLKTYVVVQTPSDKQSSQQQAVGDKECYQSMEMTAAVVALGVGLVIVLVICMFLTVKVILYRKSPSYNEKL